MRKTKEMFLHLLPFIRIFPRSFFRADETDPKVMIRSNPGLLLLHHGIILKQWHYYDSPIGKEVEKYLTSPAQ